MKLLTADGRWLSVLRIQANVTAALNNIVSAEDTSDCLRIGKVLLLQDARRKGFCGVVVVHRDRFLQNDHAVIDGFVDELDAASRDLRAIVEGLLLCIE